MSPVGPSSTVSAKPMRSASEWLWHSSNLMLGSLVPVLRRRAPEPQTLHFGFDPRLTSNSGQSGCTGAHASPLLSSLQTSPSPTWPARHHNRRDHRPSLTGSADCVGTGHRTFGRSRAALRQAAICCRGSGGWSSSTQPTPTSQLRSFHDYKSEEDRDVSVFEPSRTFFVMEQ